MDSILGGQQEVHQIFDAGTVVVIQGMIAAVGIQPDDFITGSAEGEDVVLAHQAGDLHIGTVHGAQGDGAVGMNFMLLVPLASLEARGDLLRDVAGGG